MKWRRPPKHGHLAESDYRVPQVPEPAVNMEADASGSSKIYQSNGNQYIYNEPPPYKLGQVPLPAPVPEFESLILQPSRMLRTRLEVVPFRGRNFELNQLRKWRDTGAKIAVQLIYGPGGQGKTRLATHLARTWALDGWSTYWAYSHDDHYDIDPVVPAEGNEFSGKLIVVDYAERWATSDLLALLRHIEAPASFPVRVIMLARPAGTWWQTIAYRLERDRDVNVGAMFLPPLGELPGDRMEIFFEARDCFADLLKVSNAKHIPPPRRIEVDENYGLVLTAHMAALAAVVASAQGGTPPEDPTDLSAFLLAREWDHWRALYRRREDPLHTSPDAMRQTVYTATLAGPLPYSESLAAMEYAQVESSEHPGQLIRDHALCYPPYKEGYFLEPLYPDRLGEDFLALTIPGHKNTSYPSDPWAKDALRRLLGSTEGDGELAQSLPWVLPAMNLLSEIGTRWPHVASLTWAGAFVTGRHHRRLI